MAFRLTGHKTLSLLEFYGLPDNPRQRDTEARMKRAKHLNKYDDTHSQVVIAILNGVTYKVDAHTRAAKWQTGQTSGMPEKLRLHAQVYECDTVDDLVALYEHFDSPQAVEKTPEAMSGFMRLHDAPLNSRVAKGSSPQTFAYNMLATGQDEWPKHSHGMAFAVLVPALVKLDALDPTPGRFTTATAAAALISILAYPKLGVEFWDKHQKNEGVKDSEGYDAVMVADALNAKCHAKKLHSGSDLTKQIKQYLTAFARYVADPDERYTGRAVAVDKDVQAVLKRARSNAVLPKADNSVLIKAKKAA